MLHKVYDISATNGKSQQVQKVYALLLMLSTMSIYSQMPNNN